MSYRPKPYPWGTIATISNPGPGPLAVDLSGALFADTVVFLCVPTGNTITLQLSPTPAPGRFYVFKNGDNSGAGNAVVVDPMGQTIDFGGGTYSFIYPVAVQMYFDSALGWFLVGKFV